MIGGAFIRHSNEELIKKLERLGYKFSGYGKELCSEKCIVTSGIYSNKYSFIREWMFDITDPHITWNNKHRLDCGDDEKLFLGIAALNVKDTDLYHWFYSSGWTDSYGNPIEDKWIFCDQDTLEQFAFVNNSPNSYRSGWIKANINDIIKKFKINYK